MHDHPMPRLGGIAIIAGFIVSIIYLLTVMSIEKTITLNGPDNYTIKLLGFFAAIFVLSVFCFLDDWKGIPPYIKLVGQIIAAVIITFSGIRIDKIVINHLNTIISNETISIIITIILII